MTKTRAQMIGQAKEQRALEFLQSQGLQLMATNARFRCGELDLVMKDKEIVVFIEVRFRRIARFGGAASSVVSAKQKRIRSAAQLWLLGHYGNRWPACRFDVFAMSDHAHQWIQDAF